MEAAQIEAAQIEPLGTESQILKVAFIFEGAMALLFFLFSYFDPKLLRLDAPSGSQILIAVAAALCLFILNLAFVYISYKYRVLTSVKFIEGIIEPLSRALSIKGALIVSILAGVGEELFFRGVLLPYTGVIISSILFSLAHFLVETKKYLFLASVYAGIGILFGILLELTNTLWVPIIFHILYDFLAILFFRSTLKKRLLSYETRH